MAGKSAWVCGCVGGRAVVGVTAVLFCIATGARCAATWLLLHAVWVGTQGPVKPKRAGP